MWRRLGPIVVLIAVLAVVVWKSGVVEWAGGDGRATDDVAAPDLREGADEAHRPDGSQAPVLEGRDAPAAPAPAPVVAGPRLTGRVVDPTGAGVAGARVVAMEDTSVQAFALADAAKPGGPARATTTDGEGRFALAVPAEVPFFHVYADAAGRGSALRTSVANGADVVLTLAPTFAIRGTVRDTEGKAVPGARVKTSLLLETMTCQAETAAGPDGAYRIDGLPSQVLGRRFRWRGYVRGSWIEVTAEGFAPLLLEGFPEDGAPPEVVQDVVLCRGASVTGRVEDAETGKPVAAATVLLHSIEGMQGYGRDGSASFSNPFSPRELSRTTSGEDGTYRFEHVPCQGPHPSSSHNSRGGGVMTLGGVSAWKDGWCGASDTLDLLPDGATREVALRIWPAAIVTGRVIEADGSPVEGAFASVDVPKGRRSAWSVPAFARAPSFQGRSRAPDGRFRLEGVPASASAPTPVKLRVSAPRPLRRDAARRDPIVVDATVRAGDTVDVGDVVLGPRQERPTTTVLVRRPDGTPAFGARVSGEWSGGNAARTGPDGRASVPWWEPRDGHPWTDVDVFVRAVGFAPVRATLNPPGSGPETVEVVLVPGHRVAGRVVRADGAAVPDLGVQVGDGSLAYEHVFPPNLQYVSDDGISPTTHRPALYGGATTDEQGRFAVEDLPDGPYHLSAVVPRRVPTPGKVFFRAEGRGVAADTADVVLTIPTDDSPATGKIVGAVTEKGTSSAPAGAWVSASRRGMDLAFASRTAPIGPGQSAGRFEPTGAFELPSVAEGEAILEVRARGFRGVDVPVRVRAGETTVVPPIALDRGVTVSGRMTPPQGVSIAEREVRFVPKDGGEPKEIAAIFEADGAFRASGFEAGEYRIELSEVGPPVYLVPVGDTRLVVPRDASEVRFDVGLEPAGVIRLLPMDERLPTGPWERKRVTDEQVRFGAGSRVILTGPDGKTLLDVTGIQQAHVPGGEWMIVAVGRYRARLELPGGEVREETIDLAQNANVVVRLGSKG